MLQKSAYKREQPTLRNPDRVCIICGHDYKAVAPLQKTCSVECRRIHYKGNQRKFKDLNPGASKTYNQTRLLKDPDYWKRKLKNERSEIIEALGGMCCVDGCGVSKHICLHVDYIPTMIGTGYRHPRHKRWVLDNIKDFRLLCANHHYELTITGQIEGTDITQKNRNDV